MHIDSRNYLKKVIFVVISLMFMVSPIPTSQAIAAAPIAVTTTADDFGSDGSTCSLREAIKAINDGMSFGGCANPDGLADTINLPAGVHDLTVTSSYEIFNASGDLNIRSNMTIIGAGASNTAIDGNLIDRVFWVLKDTTVSLRNIRIQHGQSSQPGGGIYNAGILTLYGVRVESNAADFGGGGIYNIDGASLNISYSEVSDNHTATPGAVGGGIENFSGTMSLLYVSIFSNSSNWNGGGLYSDSMDQTTIMRSTIDGNTSSTGSGGNIYNEGPMSIEKSIISDGISLLEGGNIYSGAVGDGGATLLITDSEIRGGQANNGGGIANDGQLTLTNSTIAENRAMVKGGALYTIETTSLTTLDHVSIAQNLLEPGASGYGIVNDTPANPVVVHNSILDAGIGDVCAGPLSDTSSYNIDSGTTCGLSGVAGLHNLSSTDPLLLPFMDNGGYMKTVAIPINSPAVDTANSSGCPATDQRGILRPIDGNLDGVNGCDIGAYELQLFTYLPLASK